MSEASKKGKRGESTVKKYFENLDYIVTKGKRGCGYDFLIKNGKKETKIEVKTSSKDKGIPDCHSSLFNKNKSVKADFFYIVRLKKKIIEVLTKKEIDSYKKSHKWIKRLRTTKLDDALYKGVVGKKIPLSEL